MLSIFSASNQLLNKFSTFNVAQIKFTFVAADGNKVAVEAQEGQSLLEIAQENEVAINAPCNGAGTCGACVVMPEAGVNEACPPSADEKTLLKDMERPQGSRLACMVKAGAFAEGKTFKVLEL